MKLWAIAALVSLCGRLTSGRPVDRRAGSGNLLQASRHGQPLQFGGANCEGIFCPESNLAGAVQGNGPVHPPDFFTNDFEKMDELPNSNPPNPKKQCHPK